MRERDREDRKKVRLGKESLVYWVGIRKESIIKSYQSVQWNHRQTAEGKAKNRVQKKFYIIGPKCPKRVQSMVVSRHYIKLFFFVTDAVTKLECFSHGKLIWLLALPLKFKA
jgi:hypothetical protein